MVSWLNIVIFTFLISLIVCLFSVFWDPLVIRLTGVYYWLQDSHTHSYSPIPTFERREGEFDMYKGPL